MYELFILFLAGICGGFLGGLLGVGGGIIFVPILDYFLFHKGVGGHDLVSYTLANSFVAVFVSGIFGSYPALKAGQINRRNLITIGVSGILSILITSYFIQIGTWYSPFLFKTVFCILLVLTLIKTSFHIQSKGSTEFLSNRIGIFSGIITGVVSGLSGLGGGIIMIPMFMILGNMNIKKASILSFAVIPILALPNIIFYLFQNPSETIAGSSGYIVWPIVAPMIIGVILSVKAGVRVAQILSPKTIKIIFAIFIVFTIFKVSSSLFMALNN